MCVDQGTVKNTTTTTITTTISCC